MPLAVPERRPILYIVFLSLSRVSFIGTMAVAGLRWSDAGAGEWEVFSRNPFSMAESDFAAAIGHF